jgi:hypothetical protein
LLFCFPSVQRACVHVVCYARRLPIRIHTCQSECAAAKHAHIVPSRPSLISLPPCGGVIVHRRAAYTWPVACCHVAPPPRSGAWL